LEAGGILGTSFTRPSVANDPASLSIIPHNDVEKSNGGRAELSTYPHIHISTYPHIHISTYPHIHSRQQKKKKQKEKHYDDDVSGIQNPCPGSYKVVGSNPTPATLESAAF
jgi:hypothetical protein